MAMQSNTTMYQFSNGGWTSVFSGVVHLNSFDNIRQ